MNILSILLLLLASHFIYLNYQKVADFFLLLQEWVAGIPSEAVQKQKRNPVTTCYSDQLSLEYPKDKEIED